MSIWNGASKEAELASPEYEIVNHGRYGVKVSLTGVTDESGTVEIDQTSYPAMELVENEAEALGSDQLYLALKGVKTDGMEEGANGFAGLGETSLARMMPDVLSQEAVVMGTLEPEKAGRFQFTAKASDAFLNTYMDPEFPLEGAENMEETRKNHYRTIDPDTGEATANKARAMFQMNYRLELVPPRRTPDEGGDGGQ